MMKEKSPIPKQVWAGWIFTVAISIAGSYGTINARVYEVEKNIEILKLEVANNKATTQEVKPALDNIQGMFNSIDKSLVEMRGEMKLKVDKKI